jgi:hypothetical protein
MEIYKICERRKVAREAEEPQSGGRNLGKRKIGRK